MARHYFSTQLARRLACIALTLLLAACGEEERDTTGATDVESGVTSPGIDGAPDLAGTPQSVGAVGVLYVFQPVATDPTGDTLTFSAQGLPAWATLDASTGRISGTPATDDAGETAQITLSVSDGNTTVSLAPFDITIQGSGSPAVSTPGTAAPTITGTPEALAIAGSTWSFTPVATDADTLTLGFSIANKPVWASFSATTGTLSGKPSLQQVGSYANIIISVNDGVAQKSLPAFSIQVALPANAAPSISGTPSGAAAVGVAYSFVPVAADPEKKTLGFSITNKPSWTSFNTATGALTGTPGAGNVGSFPNIVIGVSDGETQVSLSGFSIVVAAAPNGQPSIAGTPATAIRAGVAYNFRPTAQDPNGDALTFSITGKPAWASFNTSTGALTGTPSAANIGTTSNIVIAVSDGKSSASLSQFGITVSAATQGSATLSWNPPTQNTDGSTLTNLAGYRIYYGLDPAALASSIQITNPGLTSYTVGNLGSGTHYFAIAAYTADGVEGTQSVAGSKTIL